MSILPKLCTVPSALRPLNAPEPSRTRALDVGKSKSCGSTLALTNFLRRGRGPGDFRCSTSLMYRCCYPRACRIFDTKGHLRCLCMEGDWAPSICHFNQICYFYPETAATLRPIRSSSTIRHLGSYGHIDRRSTRRVRCYMVSMVSTEISNFSI